MVEEERVAKSKKAFPRALSEQTAVYRDSTPRAQLSRAEPYANRRIVLTRSGTVSPASLRFHEHSRGRGSFA